MSYKISSRIVESDFYIHGNPTKVPAHLLIDRSCMVPLTDSDFSAGEIANIKKQGSKVILELTNGYMTNGNKVENFLSQIIPVDEIIITEPEIYGANVKPAFRQTRSR